MLKTLILLVFRALVSIAHCIYNIEGVNALLLIMPAKLIVPTLKKYGAQIGSEAIIHSPLIIHNAGSDYRNLTIGGQCYLGRDVFLDLKERITIEDRVTLSMRTTLITHTDAGESKVKKVIFPSSAPILIDSDAYLGASATVLQGVHVGQGAVIGAGSIVLRGVPAATVVAGNPAREIRKTHG